MFPIGQRDELTADALARVFGGAHPNAANPPAVSAVDLGGTVAIRVVDEDVPPWPQRSRSWATDWWLVGRLVTHAVPMPAAGTAGVIGVVRLWQVRSEEFGEPFGTEEAVRIATAMAHFGA